MSRYQSKPGKHGTLWRYRITYRDDSPGAPSFHWATWAYDKEHALERFYESDDGDTGWRVIDGPTRVTATAGGKRRQSPSSGDVAHKGYMIRTNRISGEVWIEKGGHHIGYAKSVDDARRIIDNDLVGGKRRHTKQPAGSSLIAAAQALKAVWK